MRKHVVLVLILIVALAMGVFGAFAPSTPAQAGEVGLFSVSETHCHADYVQEGKALADAVEFIFTDGWCRAKVKEGRAWYYAVQGSVHYRVYTLYETPTPTPAPTPVVRPTRTPRPTRVAQATPVAQPTAGAPSGR